MAHWLQPSSEQTISRRIKRIEEITGLRLDNYRDRLIAQVALEILDALPEAQP